MKISLDKIWDLLLEELTTWFELGVKTFPNLIVAIFVVIVFYFLAKFGRNMTVRLARKVSSNQSIRNLTSSLAYIIVMACGVFIALGILQLDKTVTSLLAGAGVIGLALGFAFQDIASNFVSGIFIAFAKPYKVGDIVESGNYLGNVTSIQLRTTTITTFQGLEVFMPNRILFTDPLVNLTNTPMRRIDLAVGVSYGDDLEKVEQVLKERLTSLPNRVEQEAVAIYFTEFGNSSINLEAHIWVNYPNHKNFLTTQSEAVKAIKSAFDDNGIVIPFPIRTLDFGIKGGTTLHSMLKQ